MKRRANVRDGAVLVGGCARQDRGERKDCDTRKVVVPM